VGYFGVSSENTGGGLGAIHIHMGFKLIAKSAGAKSSTVGSLRQADWLSLVDGSVE